MIQLLVIWLGLGYLASLLGICYNYGGCVFRYRDIIVLFGLMPLLGPVWFLFTAFMALTIWLGD